MVDPASSDDLSVIAALTDPTRRSVYELVVDSGDAVSRDQVADQIGIARQTAAYHLDKLADEGLLEVEFVRLTGRTGPGAGRPAKTYRRADHEYEVSIPPRSYLLAARVLLEAIGAGSAHRAPVLDAARRIGEHLGSTGVDAALSETGYEPVVEDGEVRFRNCPFHALVQADRETTCALNLALVSGMVDAAQDQRRPILAPEDGYCCVRLSGVDDPTG